MNIGDKVRILKGGNLIYVVAEKSSPVRNGEWIVGRPNGSLRSIDPNQLKKVER